MDRARPRTLSALDDSALLKLCATPAPEFVLKIGSESRPVTASPTIRRVRRRANSTSTVFFDGSLASLNMETIAACLARAVMRHVRVGYVNPCDMPSKYRAFIDAGKFERLRARSRGLSYSVDSRDLDADVAFAVPPSVDPVLRRAADTKVTEPRVFEFAYRVSLSAKLEPECLVAAIVYLERIMKLGDPEFVLCHWNWRPVLISVIMLASKMWDDLSMSNSDFVKVAPTFTLDIVNALERALLSALEYRVSVSPCEWAKYTFQLRSMGRALGFADAAAFSEPLDLEAARRMHLLSTRYQGRLDTAHAVARPRSSTMDEPREAHTRIGKAQASLEELVSWTGGRPVGVGPLPTPVTLRGCGALAPVAARGE